MTTRSYVEVLVIFWVLPLAIVALDARLFGKGGRFHKGGRS